MPARWISKTEVAIQHWLRYFINVGSVGQPSDGDPRAAYAIYSLQARAVCIRRVEYDFETTQRKIREAGLGGH